MSSIVKAIKSFVSGPKVDKRAQAEAEAARKKQSQLLKQQEASNLRLQQQEDERAAELSADVAAQRRAINARRRGRSSLSFQGASTGLKTTLGG